MGSFSICNAVTRMGRYIGPFVVNAKSKKSISIMREWFRNEEEKRQKEREKNGLGINNKDDVEDSVCEL